MGAEGTPLHLAALLVSRLGDAGRLFWQRHLQPSALKGFCICDRFTSTSTGGLRASAQRLICPGDTATSKDLGALGGPRIPLGISCCLSRSSFRARSASDPSLAQLMSCIGPLTQRNAFPFYGPSAAGCYMTIGSNNFQPIVLTGGCLMVRVLSCSRACSSSLISLCRRRCRMKGGRRVYHGINLHPDLCQTSESSRSCRPGGGGRAYLVHRDQHALVPRSLPVRVEAFFLLVLSRLRLTPSTVCALSLQSLDHPGLHGHPAHG